MNDVLSQNTLNVQGKQLLRYRLPVLLAILVNCVLVIRIPLAQMRAADRSQNAPTSEHMTTAPANPHGARAQLSAVPTAVATENRPSAELTASAVQASAVQASAVQASAVQASAAAPGSASAALADQGEKKRAADKRAGEAASILGIAVVSSPSRMPLSRVPRSVEDEPEADKPTISANTGAAWVRRAHQWARVVHAKTRQLEKSAATRWTARFDTGLHTWAQSAARAAARQAEQQSPNALTGDQRPVTSSNRSSLPPSDDPPESPRARGLAITNPLNNGGVIYYVVEGRVYLLAPGETHIYPVNAARQVRFDRGGDFGTSRQTLEQGTYQFTVGDQGWQLVPAKR